MCIYVCMYVRTYTCVCVYVFVSVHVYWQLIKEKLKNKVQSV